MSDTITAERVPAPSVTIAPVADVAPAAPTAPQAQIALTDEERQPCEVWTRVMGYHRPVSSFNHGKKGEYAERVCFTETATCDA